MKYQNNFLDNKGNQPSKFRMKNWDRINNDSRGTYNTNSQTKFKTTMFKSSLCQFSGSYILVSGSTTVPNKGKQQPLIIENIRYLKIVLQLLLHKWNKKYTNR